MPGKSKPINRNLFILHCTVFVWGFTGILGQLISINSTLLVWYRVLIAFLTLLAYFKWNRISFKVTYPVFVRLFFTGAIVGLHWILFFQSIKSSTISVALVCLSSITLFTSILEPLINRRKVAGLEIITGLLIICGICLIFTFEGRYTVGIACGIFSAVFASLFSIINSKQVKNRPAPVIAFYELGGAWFWISAWMLINGNFHSIVKPGTTDFFYLLLLGIVCTSVAYVAGVSVMKELSAFRVALITNLEPVYGILMAFIFFGKKEQMTPGFYAGTLIIMAAIFLYPVASNRVERRRIRKQLPLG